MNNEIRFLLEVMDTGYDYILYTYTPHDNFIIETTIVFRGDVARRTAADNRGLTDEGGNRIERMFSYDNIETDYLYIKKYSREEANKIWQSNRKVSTLIPEDEGKALFSRLNLNKDFISGINLPSRPKTAKIGTKNIFILGKVGSSGPKDFQ